MAFKPFNCASEHDTDGNTKVIIKLDENKSSQGPKKNFFLNELSSHSISLATFYMQYTVKHRLNNKQ